MLFPVRILLLCLGLLSAGSTLALSDTQIIALAEQQARRLAAQHGGDIRIKAGPVDSSRRPACQQAEAYNLPNSRSLGRTHVGVRCVAGSDWSILVPVQIAILSTYVETLRSLQAGSTVQADDVHLNTGDLGSLPSGTLLRLEDALGKTLRSSLGAGQALRHHQLLATPVIRQGQSVQVVFQGNGFAIRGEGKALNDAAPGDTARARMGTGRTGGRTVAGIAQEDGSILLSN